MCSRSSCLATQWRLVSEMIPSRNTKQCRERWKNFLNPLIKRSQWSQEEDAELLRAHTELGNKWTEIAKRIPGRAQLHIRDRWRMIAKRTCIAADCDAECSESTSATPLEDRASVGQTSVSKDASPTPPLPSLLSAETVAAGLLFPLLVQ